MPKLRRRLLAIEMAEQLHTVEAREVLEQMATGARDIFPNRAYSARDWQATADRVGQVVRLAAVAAGPRGQLLEKPAVHFGTRLADRALGVPELLVEAAYSSKKQLLLTQARCVINPTDVSDSE